MDGRHLRGGNRARGQDPAYRLTRPRLLACANLVSVPRQVTGQAATRRDIEALTAEVAALRTELNRTVGRSRPRDTKAPRPPKV